MVQKNRRKELQKELEDIRGSFAAGSGYGNPQEQMNAQIRLQSIQSELQLNAAGQLNCLTAVLAIIAVLNLILLLVQI